MSISEYSSTELALPEFEHIKLFFWITDIWTFCYILLWQHSWSLFATNGHNLLRTICIVSYVLRQPCIQYIKASIYNETFSFLGMNKHHEVMPVMM